MSRFIRGEFLLDSPRIRRAYLNRAARSIEATDWRPLSYALMSSHVHWLFFAGASALDDVFRPLNTWFAGLTNARRDTFGPVFAGRPSLRPIEGACAFRAVAYLHNNPVRAGVVRRARDSTWTSHRVYVGLDLAPPWLDVELGLRLSGFGPDPHSRHLFDVRVDALREEPRQVDLSGPARWDDITDLARSLISVASLHARVSEEALCAASRGRDAVFGRRLVMVTWCRIFGRSAAEIAPVLGIGKAAASYLLRTADVDALQPVAERMARAALGSRS